MIKIYKLARENYFLSKYKKIIKFGVSGVVSAFIDFGILFILVEFFSVNVIIANTFSFLFAVINSYLFNKYWTFRDSEKNHYKQFAKFFLVSSIGLLINTFLMFLLIKLNIWYIFAKVIIVVIVAFWNFLANNFWTFNKQKEINLN